MALLIVFQIECLYVCISASRLVLDRNKYGATDCVSDRVFICQKFASSENRTHDPEIAHVDVLILL